MRVILDTHIDLSLGSADASPQRIALPIPFSTWLRRATASDMLNVLPLSTDALIAIDDLPPRFHGDPADRTIVATARVHNLLLATHDDAIKKIQARDDLEAVR